MTFHKPKALARRWGAAALAGTMILGLMPTVHAQTSTQSDIPVVADWKFEQQYTQGSIAAGNLVIEDQSGNGNNLVMETYGQGNWENYLSFSADSMTGAGGSLVFDGKVILGTRARKERTKSFNAFSSVDYPEIGVIRDGRLIRYLPALDAKESPDFYHTLEDRVLLLTLIPGMGTEALAALEDSYQAVILQSFGVGGLPGGGSGPFAQAVERWLQAGKTIVMLTQVPYEGSDMAVYQVGYQVKEKYRLLEGYNMTLEAAVTKLMWVLGRTRDPEQVEALFYRPVQWDIIR